MRKNQTTFSKLEEIISEYHSRTVEYNKILSKAIGDIYGVIESKETYKGVIKGVNVIAKVPLGGDGRKLKVFMPYAENGYIILARYAKNTENGTKGYRTQIEWEILRGKKFFEAFMEFYNNGYSKVVLPPTKNAKAISKVLVFTALAIVSYNIANKINDLIKGIGKIKNTDKTGVYIVSITHNDSKIDRYYITIPELDKLLAQREENDPKKVAKWLDENIAYILTNSGIETIK